MKTSLPSFAVAAGLSLAALTAPVMAEEAPVVLTALELNDSGTQRINLSGKLRMLSQRIPAAACHLANGADKEGSMKLLEGATAEFNKILKGLEFGDEELRINGEEERAKTVVKIKALTETWMPVSAAAEAIISGDMSDANLQVVLGQNMAVLDDASVLVTEISGEYANPFELVQADALLIDIAGRQRMLTQKMSKESCMVSNKMGTDETAAALQGTMDMFTTSLIALSEGMPEAGIRRPPTAAIAAGLQDVAKYWDDVKPSLDAILAGTSLDADAQAAKFQALNETMAVMNEVVGMYSKAVKQES